MKFHDNPNAMIFPQLSPSPSRRFTLSNHSCLLGTCNHQILDTMLFLVMTTAILAPG